MSSSFELQPTLSGALIVLEPLKISEFDAVYKAASDPKIWEQHPIPLRYKREVFQGFLDGAIESKGAFAIRDIQTNTIIGSSRYYEYDPEKSRIVIGYTFLARNYWGGNFNRELKKLMLDHAFQFVDTVHFHIGSLNRRSQIAMERIGGIKVDELEMKYPPNTTVLNYVYEIKKENWI
jgi:RimJ/RimL family protein N-acetyltransferase